MLATLHPLIIHFPIALLFLYGILEIFPIGKWYPYLTWESIKTFLAVTGSLGAGAAIITGLQAGAGVTGEFARVVEVHRNMGIGTALIFGLLAFARIARLVIENRGGSGSFLFLQKISRIILSRPIAITLCLAGLFTLTIGASLGGSLVYGPEYDPVVKFAYWIFIN